MKTWNVSDSAKLYHVESWGNRYFGMNDAGNLTVHPRRQAELSIDLKKVVDEVRAQGLGLPVLIRFQDIIRHRVEMLNETFQKVIAEFGYYSHYQGVYPIKVNQLREVVEEILDAGRNYHFGLEAGSKAELAAVIGMDIPAQGLIICNGYKDYAFLKMALMGTKLGKKVIIVIEKLSELQQLISLSREMGVVPWIGIRSKLYTRGSGRWESSGGEDAKFGLTTPELLQAVNLLREVGLESSFKLLHFHIGSQVTDIKTISDAVKEGTRIFAKLCKMGLQLEYLDVGGGLGVDYDGSMMSFESSINYSLEEYVRAVVYTIQEVSRAEQIRDPIIVSESGRALVAHHSVLVVDVFGAIEVGATPIEMVETSDENPVVKEMRSLLQPLSLNNLLECFHDALQRKEEALSMFKLGFLALEDKAKVEYLFWQICKIIHQNSAQLDYVSPEVEQLKQHLADQYLCNFSLFQSVPDYWAIQHLFPIVPIHRHQEQPTRQATLVDITCDSDGKICKFIHLKGVHNTLSLHELKLGEPYSLGFFLMGAYQDIMGDLHNLFGRVNEVHVFLDETEPSGYYIEEVIRGSNIASVLSWIQYSATDLEKRVKQQIDARVREGHIKPREGVELQNFYEAVLHGYTYVDFNRIDS